MLKELDLVALAVDLPTRGLIAGDTGTLVFVYPDGRAYEVEFVAADGRTLAVETLRPEQIEPVSGRHILHASACRRAPRAGERDVDRAAGWHHADDLSAAAQRDLA